MYCKVRVHLLHMQFGHMIKRRIPLLSKRGLLDGQKNGSWIFMYLENYAWLNLVQPFTRLKVILITSIKILRSFLISITWC